MTPSAPRETLRAQIAGSSPLASAGTASQSGASGLEVTGALRSRGVGRSSRCAPGTPPQILLLGGRFARRGVFRDALPARGEGVKICGHSAAVRRELECTVVDRDAREPDRLRQE